MVPPVSGARDYGGGEKWDFDSADHYTRLRQGVRPHARSPARRRGFGDRILREGVWDCRDQLGEGLNVWYVFKVVAWFSELYWIEAPKQLRTESVSTSYLTRS